MAIWDPIFYGTGWNKVETALRTSRLISLAHLPDQECPKYGPTWAKKGPKEAFKSLLATQIIQEGLFWVGRVGTRLEHPWRHPDGPVWAICHTRNVSIVALRWPKRGQHRLTIAFWSHKSVQRAYFGLGGVEQGWDTNEDIHTDCSLSSVGWLIWNLKCWVKS